MSDRKVYAQVPPKVEYSISKRGQSLKPIIDPMWKWGKDFLDALPEERVKPKTAKGEATYRQLKQLLPKSLTPKLL